MSETLTRYEFVCNNDHNAEAQAYPDGGWVRYDDAQAALTHAEQTGKEVIDGMAEEIQELRAELAKLTSE